MAAAAARPAGGSRAPAPPGDRGSAGVGERQTGRSRAAPADPETSARIQALPLERLDALAEALLDFNSPQDLHSWLQQHD
ncbi:DUF4351 domain-containing protein [Synechococcus sp. CCY9202]|uniref:DUF4351 domain-containing protein n=1 Tax=Synechococcus sp. CCY9202 TaxID=174698 RepID=UPI002B21A9FB|nr:DUF4351 domain-containing protein [Synechococcus sp. CCY9202]MEA5423926.1 DUF4351 domain-containing protein [Synechococcus sp. CCY9202]